MHAVLVEVDVPEGMPTDTAREALQQNAVPRIREAGARAGYWLSPVKGRGVNVTLYDTEDAAKTVAGWFTIGQAHPAHQMASRFDRWRYARFSPTCRSPDC
jgi:hypothetical protein